MTEAELLLSARAWADGDPDLADRAEISALLAAQDLPSLRDRFAAPLTFGTAGLRGLVGAGPARMNRAVVIRTTRALAESLPHATGPVVIGHDTRLSSPGLASAAAGTLAAAGIPVQCFDSPVPTPLVAYAVRLLSARAGIAITASHNPADYNGYKLFGSEGIQVVPPADAEIEKRTRGLGSAASIPVVDDGAVDRHPLVARVAPAVTDSYVRAVLLAAPEPRGDRALRVVYTPMHGVGGPLAQRLLAERGFHDVHVVPEQAVPDGNFPTAPSPNPEDPSVLALALRDARAIGADLVLANDPDADRLAVCVPDGRGGWLPLTGNQIGVLLADFVLRSRDGASPARTPLLVTTLVSTPMLASLARARGAAYEETLTGFKWLWTAGAALEKERGVEFAFGCEEAIGFSVGRVVRDKDGLSAALVMAELAATCRAEGTSVLQVLSRLEAELGTWVSAQRSVVRRGAEGAHEIERAVDRLAGSPPREVLGMRVLSVTDFRAGHAARPPWLGASPIVRLDLGPTCRIIVRPSGTEPKLKIYVDLAGAEGAPDAREALTARAGAMAEAVLDVLGLS